MLELAMPKTLYDLPLNRYIDFLVRCRDLKPFEQEQGATMALQMCRALSDFFAVKIETMLFAEIGNGNVQRYNSAEKTVSQLFAHVTNFVSKHESKPLTEKFEFTHRREDFVLNSLPIKAAFGEMETYLPALNVLEVIEAAELQRLKVEHIRATGDPDGSVRMRILETAIGVEQKPETVKALKIAAGKVADLEIAKLGDPNGSVVYSGYLKLIAILAKKPGEYLPTDDVERDVFINNRIRFFADISAGVALDVDFFLTNTLQAFGNEGTHIGFLTRQSIVLVLAATPSKRPKPLKSKRATTRQFSNA